MRFFYYETANGRTNGDGYLKEGERLEEKADDTYSTIEAPDSESDPHDYYVAGGALHLREQLSPAVTAAGITGLPSACYLSITGPITFSGEVEAGDTSITFDLAGDYLFDFWPHDPHYYPATANLTI